MKDPASLEAIQEFLVGYRAVRGLVGLKHSKSEFITEFARLAKSYQVLRDESRERQLRQAPDYNIFEILRLERNEVRTHSAFLSHLLTPTASHGQRLLFLQSFLKYCASRHPEFPKLPAFDAEEDWLVSSEEHTYYGRLDILIQNPHESF